MSDCGGGDPRRERSPRGRQGHVERALIDQGREIDIYQGI